MEYIFGRLNSYRIKYVKVNDNTLRVYGNFKGFSVVREAYEDWIEVDGKLIDKADFESWLFAISV